MKKITLFFLLLLFTALNYTAKAAESQTAACTAGNLATVAASYLTTVTNLTVTGTIDARDFKTMRDNMPLLEVIDLSGSTVKAYNGTAGTSGTGTTSISYPANEIPNYAFYNPSADAGKTNLKTFNYPSAVTTIGNYAFSDCYGFTGSLTIPSSVTTIGNDAFRYCNGFSGSLTIPSAVTTIGSAAFANCSGFTGSLTIPSTVTTIGNWAFYNCYGFTGSLTIPSSVTTIGNDAFSGCSGFTGSLTIPSAVTSIGDFTFSGCSGFTGSLTIPSAVTTIGNDAFYNCYGFTSSLTIPSAVTTIGNDAFSGCNGFTGSLTIPSSVKTIGKYAFFDCNGFTGSLTIPSSVTTIGNYAFSDCSGLFEVNEANPNYSSFDGVLYNKNKTTLIQCLISKTGSLIIPSSVTTIGDGAFYKCSGFTGSLTIPSSVTTIGEYAFCDCIGLTSIHAYATTPIDLSGSSNVFLNVNKAIPLHVPVGKKQLYADANQWQDFTNKVDDIVPTSINVVLSNTISIYPNPATSSITISELGSLEGNQNVTISIIDVLGNVLVVKEVEPTINSLSIDVSAFKKGIYFINMQTSNGNVVKRFVKE